MIKFPVQWPQGILLLVDVFDNDKICVRHLTDIHMNLSNHQITTNTCHPRCSYFVPPTFLLNGRYICIADQHASASLQPSGVRIRASSDAFSKKNAH